MIKESRPGDNNSSERIGEAIAKVEAKHNPDQVDCGRMRTFLTVWFKKLGGLEGKRILDIGCGSRASVDIPVVGGRTYEPWVCRALYEAGADPVGMDIGSLDGEEFEHYQKSILDPDAFASFPDESFDGVSASSLFNSPALSKSARPSEIEEARERFLHEATRILRPGGVAMIAEGDFLIWRKMDGVLVPESIGK